MSDKLRELEAGGTGIKVKFRGGEFPCYPFDAASFEQGVKVVTRDGRVVRSVAVDDRTMGDRIVTGILDGRREWWDMAGRYTGPYEDSVNDLYIPERYFVDGWKDLRHMSNAEWRAWYNERRSGDGE